MAVLKATLCGWVVMGRASLRQTNYLSIPLSPKICLQFVTHTHKAAREKKRYPSSGC
jgi:hypothetical protein